MKVRSNPDSTTQQSLTLPSLKFLIVNFVTDEKLEDILCDKVFCGAR